MKYMFSITLCLLAQSVRVVGFEQTGYTVLEGESVEVCIAVMAGSFASPVTFNQFPQAQIQVR